MNKKLFIIIIIIILSFKTFTNERENNTELIKRTVAIFPFVNINKVIEYNYLSGTIRNALKAELLNTDNFLFSDFSYIDEKIIKNNFSIEEMINEKDAKKISANIKADVVIIGKYIIVNKKILIQIEVYDIFKDKLVASSSIHKTFGLDIFDIIDEISKDIKNKINENLGKVEKAYFDEMMRVIQEKNKDTKSYTLSPHNKVGIVFTITGGSLILLGVPLLIYDLAGYSEIMIEKKNIYYEDNTDANYQAAQNSIDIFRSLFIVSVVVSSLGVISLSIGIPLTIINKKKKDISFNMDLNTDISVYLKIKI